MMRHAKTSKTESYQPNYACLPRPAGRLAERRAARRVLRLAPERHIARRVLCLARSVNLRVGLCAAALLCLLLPLAALGQAQKAETNKVTFTFLHISDTAQTADGEDVLTKYADSFSAAPGKPDFVVATGNLTAGGQDAEFSRVRRGVGSFVGAGIGFYAVPGPNDARRSPSGKEGFTSLFGKTYQSFDRGGAHFILLDTTVLLQKQGHFEKSELDFIAKDLKRVRPETPILLFTGHAVGRDTPLTRPVDNEFEFWPLFAKFNLMAVFCGGQADDIGHANGVPVVATRGLAKGAYHRIYVTPLMITIERLTPENPDKAETLVKIPIRTRNEKSTLLAGWNDPDVPFLARRRPTAKLEPRAFADNPEGEQGEYRIDGGGWKLLTRDARDYWSDQFLTKAVPVGIHTAEVRVTTSRATVLNRELIFEVERDINEPSRQWAYNLDGAIQSSPLVDDDTVFVGSNDGKITALARASRDERGKKKWETKTKGAVTASPVLANGVLYVGSTDHNFYALDAATGKTRWHYDTGSPIFSTAAVAQGVVCFGGNGKIYGLDAVTGNPKWTHPADRFFQSAAATDGESFYLGGWGNTLYVLDAGNGTARWTAAIGRNREGKFNVSQSPAVSSPAVGQGRVSIAGLDGVLYAMNTRDGAPLWQIQAPNSGDPFGQGAVTTLDGRTLYVTGAGEQGTVYAIDGGTGHIIWHTAIGQPIYGGTARLSPDAKTLAVMGFRGRVAVLDTQTGSKFWTYELGPGNIFSTPGYDGQAVYTVTMENDVQAINAPAAKPARSTAAKN